MKSNRIIAEHCRFSFTLISQLTFRICMESSNLSIESHLDHVGKRHPHKPRYKKNSIDGTWPSPIYLSLFTFWHLKKRKICHMDSTKFFVVSFDFLNFWGWEFVNFSFNEQIHLFIQSNIRWVNFVFNVNP